MITNVSSRVLSLDVVSVPGLATVSFSGVPWYFYEAQRATNATFIGALQTWPVQAGSDGAISIADDFNDLGTSPAEAYYRLRYLP